MTTNTAIEWCDHTWNPWQGCHKVSEGCKNCYMYRDMKRYGKTPDTVVRSAPATFQQPLKKGWKPGDKVFVCSWSDFFHEAADEWRPEAWELIRKRDDVRYIIVTKRIDRAASCLPPDWGDGWPHVALLVSVENQKRADERIPVLFQTPAVIRGVSAEPLLGPVDLTQWMMCESCLDPAVHWCGDPKLNWIIVGAESGPDARPMDIEWAHTIADDCRALNVPFFMKQICVKGRKLEYQDFPFDLRIRKFPRLWETADEEAHA